MQRRTQAFMMILGSIGRILSLSSTRYSRSPSLTLAFLAGSLACSVSAHAQEGSRRDVFVTPDVIISEDGEQLDIERGLIVVPENRRKAESRSILVHFLRVKSKNPPDDGMPVVMLPGGPGYDYDFSEARPFAQIQRLSQNRDLIYVSQRGFYGAPGLVPDLRARFDSSMPLDRPRNLEEGLSQEKKSVSEALSYWRRRGIDVDGYDMLNIVDDVYELRDALGYNKIILRGCSFGSQWSFAYLKRWPETVDRALLSGVEPLDFAYDSPSWIWASLGRLAEQASRSPALKDQIPEGGLLEAIQSLVIRLEEAPVAVDVIDPVNGKLVTVVLGADDLRTRLRGYTFLMRDTPHENLAHWPRFVLEMVEGDFRFLAALTLDARRNSGSTSLITYSVDNSIGISKSRDLKLADEPENRWLAINTGFRSVRDLFSNIDVGDDFRSDQRSVVPTLLVSGDLDWSTPIENAQHALRFLDRGHLVTVKGATHCPLNREEQILSQHPESVDQIRRFLDLDFDKQTPEDYFSTLPTSIELAPIEFAPVTNVTLYDELLARRGQAK